MEVFLPCLGESGKVGTTKGRAGIEGNVVCVSVLSENPHGYFIGIFGRHLCTELVKIISDFQNKTLCWRPRAWRFCLIF
jgi:hypothetical protein